jgi:hypothetical protein
MSANGTIDLVVEDLSGQVRRRARGVSRESTVGDFISGLTREMRLPANDLQGRPLTYGARTRGESLVESDRVGDVLDTEDVVTLVQNVTAG